MSGFCFKFLTVYERILPVTKSPIRETVFGCDDNNAIIIEGFILIKLNLFSGCELGLAVIGQETALLH